MSHLTDPNLFHPILPENVAGDEEINLRYESKCEMRSSQNNNFLGYHQRMPATQKITDIKKALGYGSKTHYKTMLKNPTRKLRSFVYPKMTPARDRPQGGPRGRGIRPLRVTRGGGRGGGPGLPKTRWDSGPGARGSATARLACPTLSVTAACA